MRKGGTIVGMCTYMILYHDKESIELVKNMFSTEDSFVNIPKIQI